MIRNYLLIALRLLVKNKIFSLINIVGLSTGIACCILITLYIQDEFNYEKDFTNHKKIFRVNTTWIKDGREDKTPNTSPPIAFGLARALPEIEIATRVVKPADVEQHIIRYQDKLFFEKSAFLVDSTFLKVFPYKLAEGNPATALDAPASVLISQKLASRIFGKNSPLDETLIINSGSSADTFQITGVVATPKFPSHIDADVYMSMESNGWGRWVLSQTTWANNNMVEGYVMLQNPDSYKAVEAKFPPLVEMHAGAELKASGRQKILTLQPLDEIRLHSDMRKDTVINEASSTSITYIYIIGTIGAFILLLACINFMNLTTARSSQRASEIGIRKSMGAFKSNLISQFLGESFILVTFALIVSFLMVIAALPVFNSIMQKQLTLNASNLPFIAGTAVIICVFTALVAGSYPAFFLSSLKPAHVLKGKSLSSDGSQRLRKSLVVFQFVITITLISSIVIIQRQLKYIQSKSLGFDTEQVIMIPMRTQSALQQYSALKESFSQFPGVNVVSGTTSIPSTPLFTDWGIYKQGWSNDQSVTHDIVRVDRDYFKTLNIDLIAGRDFLVDQDNLPTDTLGTTKIIVNESSLKAFDIPLDKAVGHAIFFEPGAERYEMTIIGVVKDFHQFSLHQQIGPMLFMLPSNRNAFPYLALSINTESFKSIEKQMKTIWDQRINDAPLETVFLKDNIKTLYKAEDRTSAMLAISTTIALVISCLGLYGLSVFMAERKTKEIGIRKVVGASVESIIAMLSKEYIRLIAISFIISIPLGYYLMDKWLEGFAYRITPGITVFLVSGALSFFIAWLTISFESFRAARKNPVDTFRSN
jgi:putative ABC transport system permease protein